MIGDVTAIAVAAMESEAQSLLELAAHQSRLPSSPGSRRALLTFDDTDSRVLLVTSGIGLVNASAALSATIETLSAESSSAGFVASIGTAGGFPARVRVGDVAASTSLTYSVADATAFGYEPGQIPQMPAQYAADERLLARLPESVVAGPFISGDTFVAGDLFDGLVKRWPDAVATDMESTALAQVAHVRGLPFISIRGVSDLCGPAAAQQHTATVEQVSTAAARALVGLL